ncbi:MAG: hypothetical protein V8Q21_00435 [Akkermansia muciniphila]
MMNTYEHGIRKTYTSVAISRMKASRKPWSPSGRNPPGTRSATETAAPPEEKQEWDGDHQLARQASAHAGVPLAARPQHRLNRQWNGEKMLFRSALLGFSSRAHSTGEGVSALKA